LESKKIGPGTVDLVCAHPPYLDAIRYTEKVAEDLSHIADAEAFCDEIQKVAGQLFTLLKPGGRCAVLIGDVRKNGKTTPLGFKVMERFQRARFEVEEIIIKEQHRDESTEFYFNKNSVNYRLAHEYIFVFLK
jgi:methylase of polypeptide subunit release factors